MRYLLIASLLTLAHQQPFPFDRITDVHVNGIEVALHIFVEIPVNITEEEEVKGLENFYDNLQAILPVKEARFKACLDVNLPADEHDTHNWHSWQCVYVIRSDTSTEPLKQCVKDLLEVRKAHGNSTDPPEKDFCKNLGAPELVAWVKLDTTDDEHKWKEQAKAIKNQTKHKGADVVIVTNSFNASVSTRTVVLDVNSANESPTITPSFGIDSRQVAEGMWTIVENLLHLCNYTGGNASCYYYHPDASIEHKEPRVCMLGYNRKGLTKDPSHDKYCVHSHAFQEPGDRCVKEDCEKNCRDRIEYDGCNCQIGGRKRYFVPVKRNVDVERHLWQCDGYGVKVDQDCNDECESHDGITMLVAAFLILVLTAAAVFAVYWIWFRERPGAKPLSPPPKIGPSAGEEQGKSAVSEEQGVKSEALQPAEIGNASNMGKSSN